MDVTNECQNNLKASSEREIIDFPPHYLSHLNFRFPTIHIQPAPNVRCVVEIFCVMQVTKPSGCQCNTLLSLVISFLGFIKHVTDYSLYNLKKNSTKAIYRFCPTIYPKNPFDLFPKKNGTFSPAYLPKNLLDKKLFRLPQMSLSKKKNVRSQKGLALKKN